MTGVNITDNLVSQSEVNEMLRIHEIINPDEKGYSSPSLLDEIKDAILDSGKLKLDEWKSLRDKIREIEDLVPHMDMIIRLKEQQDRRERIIGS